MAYSNPNVETVMKEYKEGTLRSGSSKGSKVEDPRQAIAIALSEAGVEPKKRKKKKKSS